MWHKILLKERTLKITKQKKTTLKITPISDFKEKIIIEIITK